MKDLVITLLQCRPVVAGLGHHIATKSAAALREQLSALGCYKAHTLSEQASLAEGVVEWWNSCPEQRPLAGVWQLPAAAHLITAVLSQAGGTSDSLLPIAGEHLFSVADQILMGIHALRGSGDLPGRGVRTGALPVGAIFRSGLHMVLLERVVLPHLREQLRSQPGNISSAELLLNPANDKTENAYPELVEALHNLLFTQARKVQGLVHSEMLRLPAAPTESASGSAAVAQGTACQVRDLLAAYDATQLGVLPGLDSILDSAAAPSEDEVQLWQAGLSALRGHFPLRARVVFYCYGALARRAWEDGFERLVTSRDTSADLIALHAVFVRYGGEVAVRRQLTAPSDVRRLLGEVANARREVLLAFRELLRCEMALAKWLMCPGYGSRQMASF